MATQARDEEPMLAGTRIVRLYMAAASAFARRPVSSTLMLGAAALIATLILTAFAGIPEPAVHDELAQLVSADIFAHGKLCESPHRFARHFETIQVLSYPCYQGKYPPGPALFMAVGQLLTGLPIAGVWLGVFLMICSCAYAARAWLPPPLALATVALIMLRFGVVGSWTQSYWGGALAAAGGALVLGGVRHVLRTPRVRDGVLLGVGLVLLAYSRPFEGAVFSLCLTVPLLRIIRRRSPAQRIRVRALAACLPILVAGGAWQLWYNTAVTGKPMRMPYMAYENAYMATRAFIWQAPRDSTLAIAVPEMAHNELDEVLPDVIAARSHWPWRRFAELAQILWSYLKPTLAVAFLGLILRPRYARRTRRFAALGVLAVLFASTVSTWAANRYFAPATAALFILVTIGFNALARTRLGRLSGRTIAIVSSLAFVATIPAAAVRDTRQARQSTDWWAFKRDFREGLLRTPQRDLVFVHYSPAHPPHNEWVYNGAEIDQQPIVWAREVDPDDDARLREYFSDRRVWTVYADEVPPRLAEGVLTRAPTAK